MLFKIAHRVVNEALSLKYIRKITSTITIFCFHPFDDSMLGIVFIFTDRPQTGHKGNSQYTATYL